MSKAKTRLLKKSKKRWFRMVAPALFNNAVLGESLVTDASELIGRVITLNLASITGDIKMQNINVSFKINEAVGENANTTISGYEMSSSSIKRLVRRNVDRIDSSIVVNTQEGICLRVKSFILTENKTKGSVLKVLKSHLEAEIVREVASQPFEGLIRDILGRRIQMALRKSLRKIYPVRASEIRRVVICTGGKPHKVKEIAAAEPTEEEYPDQDEDEAQAAEPIAEKDYKPRMKKSAPDEEEESPESDTGEQE